MTSRKETEMDTIEYEGEVYDLVGVHGEGLFSPEENGLDKAGRWAVGPHVQSFINIYRVEGYRLLLSAVWSQYYEVRDNPFEVRAKIYPGEWPARYEGLSWPTPFRGRVLLGRDFVESCRIHGRWHPAWTYGKVVELFFGKWGVLVWSRDVSMEMGLMRDVFTEVRQRSGVFPSGAMRGGAENMQSRRGLFDFATEYYPFNRDYKWEYVVAMGVPVEVRAALCRLDPGVRVILASASDLRDIVAGHDNVVAGIRKPFDRGRLIEVIENVLG
jgi:hypothetical protein